MCCVEFLQIVQAFLPGMLYCSRRGVCERAKQSVMKAANPLDSPSVTNDSLQFGEQHHRGWRVPRRRDNDSEHGGNPKTVPPPSRHRNRFLRLRRTHRLRRNVPDLSGPASSVPGRGGHHKVPRPREARRGMWVASQKSSKVLMLIAACDVERDIPCLGFSLEGSPDATA